MNNYLVYQFCLKHTDFAEKTKPLSILNNNNFPSTQKIEDINYF